MHFTSLAISDVKLFTPRAFTDERGFFMETFKSTDFCQAVEQDIVFVQDNQSLSKFAYTLRGLHYQCPPQAQGKLIRCTRGSILDVAVDARIGSPSYGQHVKVRLDANKAEQIWVPTGFLHGFLTLEPDTEVQYKCTSYYNAECDGNVIWNDPDLAIDWGVDDKNVVLSKKDTTACTFAKLDSPFTLA